MSERGRLIILSGPSGAGKGTVLAKALEDSISLTVSVSCTTRKPRPGEVNGVNYHFKSTEEFQLMIANDELLEYENVFGNMYGTSRVFVEKSLEQSKDVVLEIDVKGALNVKQIMPEAIMIFLVPKDRDTLTSRLRNRGTETEEQLAKRLGEASAEISRATCYDYIIINDELERCSKDFLSVINAEKCKTINNLEIIKSYLGGTEL